MTKRRVIRIVATQLLTPGVWTLVDGRLYLRSFDPDAHAGRGEVLLTERLSHAKVFPDSAAAMSEWKRVSKLRPVRADGKPNRPLTAYTIEIISPDPEDKQCAIHA